MYSAPQAVRAFLPRINEEEAARSVRSFLSDSTVYLDFNCPEILGREFWSEKRPRSEGRKAHGWFFMRQWNCAVNSITDLEKTQLVAKFATFYSQWTIAAQNDGSMAYHDETTAQRVLAASVFISNFKPQIEAEGLDGLRENLSKDLHLLESNEFYAGANNHGMFQNIALLVAYEYGFANERAQSLAIQRLVEYFNSCFTMDGIHTENNPTYHVMVSRYLKLVAEYLTSIGQDGRVSHLREILEKADTYAAFCVMPNGKFPPISDTNLAVLRESQAVNTFGTGHFQAAITQGKRGSLPSSKAFIAEDSGYAIFRTGWDSNASVTFFSAAYNDDYHKHSDELSVYMYANGHELLAEAGPNGYQYSDKLTAYAFSSFAHNTLIVDGVGLNRIDSNAATTHLVQTNSPLSAHGVTGRFTDVDWGRTVDASALEEKGLLVISDVVRSSSEHSYKFLWHLGLGIIPVVRGNFIELFSSSTREKVGELYAEGQPFVSVQVLHGQRHPRVQGFSFPTMGDPRASYVIEFEAQGKAALPRWEVRTRDFLLNERGVTPFNAEWRTFYGEKPVRYLIDRPAEAGLEEAVIVFSAVNPKYDFTYNYRSSFADYRGTVIYVLDDFGDQGSYYLANNRDFAEFRSVQAALRSIVHDLGIPMSKVYTFGSSKGGAGALHHGVSLGVNTVFMGAPQYKIGLFTKNPHPNILNYVAGGTTISDVNWLDSVGKRILQSGCRHTKLVLLVGEADGHYKYHAVPLIDDARSEGYKADLLALPGTKHSELGAACKKLVHSFVMSREPNSTVVPHSTAFDAVNRKLGVVVSVPDEWDVLGQLLIDGEKEGRIQRFNRGRATWGTTRSGLARVRVYIDRHDGLGRQAFGTSAVRVSA